VTTNTTYSVRKLSVQGMHCGACEKLITMNARKIDGVADVVADAQEGFVTFFLDHDVLLDPMVDAIVAAGFTPGDPLVLEESETSVLPGNGQGAAVAKHHEMDAAHQKLLGKKHVKSAKGEMSAAEKIKIIDTNGDSSSRVEAYDPILDTWAGVAPI